MHIRHGINFPACLAQLAQQGLRHRVSEQGLFNGGHPQRDRCGTAQGERNAGYLALGILFEKRCRRDHGVVTVAPGKFYKCVAVSCLPYWKLLSFFSSRPRL